MVGRCASCGNGFDDDDGATYAMRQLWHKEHFVCALCSRQLRHSGDFRIDARQPFCTDCLVTVRKPKCAGCDRTVRESCVVAVNKSWHRSCFVCAACRHPFAGNEHYLLDQLPYDVDCYWKRRCELADIARQPAASPDDPNDVDADDPPRSAHPTITHPLPS